MAIAVMVDGQEIPVSRRLGRMIVLLLQEQARIDAIQSGHVQINCTEDSVKATIVSHHSVSDAGVVI